MTDDDKNMRNIAKHQLGILAEINELISRHEDAEFNDRFTLYDQMLEMGKSFEEFTGKAKEFIDKQKERDEQNKRPSDC